MPAPTRAGPAWLSGDDDETVASTRPSRNHGAAGYAGIGNRASLEDIPHLPIGGIAALPPDQRALLMTDGEFVVVADLPKRVHWDQSKLAEAMAIGRRDWQEDAPQFVRTELKVAESACVAWPEAIRRLFEPARTVEAGKPAYRIEPVGMEAA